MSKHLLEELTKSKRARKFIEDLTSAGIPMARSELLAKKFLYLAKPKSFGKKVGKHYTFNAKSGGTLIVTKTSSGFVIKGPTTAKVTTKARPKTHARSVRRHK